MAIRRPIPKEDLEYVRLLVTTLIAVLALPFVLALFWLHPKDAAHKAVGGAV